MARVKKIVTMIIVLALVIVCLSPSAYALGRREIGALFASALAALNITIQSTVAPIVQAYDFIADPFKITGSQFYPVDYTHSWDDDFLSKSTISIDEDVVTIDGIDYYNVWLSHDAADKFRVNAFDLENAFDLTSESEGTFVTGVGSIGGVPVYALGDSVTSSRSPTYHLSGINDYNTGIFQYGNYFQDDNVRHYLSSPFSSNSWGKAASQFYVRATASSGSDITRGEAHLQNNAGTLYSSYVTVPSSYIDNANFDFDWVSGDLNPIPLDPDDGLHLFLPANDEQWSDNPEVQDVIRDVQQFYTDTPDLSPGTQFSPITPDIETKLEDLIDIIMPIIPIIQTQFGPKDSTPIPPEPDPQPEPFPDPQPEPVPFPDPEPGTTISDTDWKSLFDWLKNIFQRLASIDVSSQTISNVVTEMRNRFEYWFEDLRTNIQNGVRDIISSISDLGNTILQDIETGPIIRIQRGLDKIKQIFLPVLIPLKNALGIWHYVIEWLQVISLPFQWILSIGTQGYSAIMIPVYACVAGTLCIVVYRKFGR